jgi:hypothetical protein
MNRKSPRASKATGTFEEISFAADASKDTTNQYPDQSFRTGYADKLGPISEHVVARIARRGQISKPYATTVAGLILTGGKR